MVKVKSLLGILGVIFLITACDGGGGGSGGNNQPVVTVPSAPSNLTATAVSATQINLAWTDNSTNETGFKIERRIVPAASPLRAQADSTFAQIGTVGAGITAYQDTGCAASTSYEYRVRAYNSSSDSAYSNVVAANTNGSSMNITLTGQFNPGTVSLSPSTEPFCRASANTLAGYKLYCVTFLNPPVAATSQPADANGNVSITIAAKDIPFGCFILDSGGNAVAAILFSGTSGTGQAAQFSVSANLGTITVDLGAGISKLNIPAGGAVITTTPPGAECLVGKWEATNIGCSPCAPGNMTGTIWISKLPSGKYTESMIVGPACLGDACSGCGDLSFINSISSTYQNGTLTFTMQDEESCPEKTLTVTLTPDGACQNAAVSYSITKRPFCVNYCDGDWPGCGCEIPRPEGPDCGSLTCPNGPYSFTKK
jgi:hypothetical protein